VFKLTPETSSQGTTWTQTILHSFKPPPPKGSTGEDADGEEPAATPVLDAHGNLFGTTDFGGRKMKGTVFMLTAPARGQTRWKEQVIYSIEGGYPNGTGLIIDSLNQVYGTESSESFPKLGSVYRLTPPAPGSSKWQMTTLFTFLRSSEGVGGGDPVSGVVFDMEGNLYGEVSEGGAQGAGGVFKLSPPAGGEGGWTETLIYSFTEGRSGKGGMAFDSGGSLYGVTGGGSGSVFRLSPPAQLGQSWIFTDLYNFGEGGLNDGTSPGSGVAVSSAGVLYGTTPYGGVLGNGTVFELDPPAAGQTAWAEKILSSFSESNGDGGRIPTAGVAIDSEGRLVGTASLGGKGACYFNSELQGCGTVFQLRQPH
jgi:hypothetical protein